MAFESSGPKRHSVDFGSLEKVRGAWPPPVFNQIQFDIYPFLTPGSDRARGCQLGRGHIPDLDGSFRSDSSPSSDSAGSLRLCFFHLTRGRVPSLEPSPEITARPWAWLFQWKGGLLLRLVSDVSAGGWLPGKVSNTQFLPKQNKNQHMQLKLLKSGLLILKQTVLPALNFKYFWPLDEQIFHYLH